MNTKRIERYYDALRSIPASGGGGCHTALLGIANFGRHAGVNRERVAQDLGAQVHGTRKVTEAEIAAAVSKAFDSPGPFLAPTARPIVDGPKFRDAILQRGAGCIEADLWEMSPVRIDWPLDRDAVELLRHLYHPEDRLFIGARHDSGIEHIRPAWEWITRFENGAVVLEHIVPNPLTGQPGLTKNNRPSYRADSCVAQFRFAVIEFDGMARDQQIWFWAGAKLPVVALLDSGGKSIHGWIRIDAGNVEEWERYVEHDLFSLAIAVGADGACRNEARLSRMVGHFRAETNNWQRILYLNPPGGPLIP